MNTALLSIFKNMLFRRSNIKKETNKLEEGGHVPMSLTGSTSGNARKKRVKMLSEVRLMHDD